MSATPAAVAEEITRLYRERRHADLEACARRWLKTRALDGNLWKALGVACAAQGKHDEALAAKRRAAELLPNDVEAHTNLANALSQAGRVDEVARCRARLAELQPGSAGAWVQLGCALRDANDGAGARRAFERALGLDPKDAEALMNLGCCLAQEGEAAQAEARFHEALEILPDAAAIHSNLGNLLRSVARHDEALSHLRRAIELQPGLANARSNYLMTLSSAPGVTAQQGREAASDYGKWLSARVRPAGRPTRARAGTPLRVGFVSGDLREHPVACFLESFLAHWPGRDVQLVGYPTVPAEDAVTQRLRPAFAEWHPLFHLDDARAGALIAQHGIDVLVDLAGHTAYNRLPVFAQGAAHAQASWLGYFASTGVEQMDWIVSDEVSTPAGHEAEFTERVWRLPRTRHCFTPPRDAPEVTALPAREKGHVTFASFQNLRKIHGGVLDAWSAVLRAVPDARIRLQNSQFADPQAQRELLLAFEARGIAPGRVAMHGRSSREGYWRAHAEVDLILDTFPYPGATTTCEALWMGVPTVTLTGETMLARLGHTMLAAAGLANCVAASPQAYVDVAVGLARDTRALAQMRAGMRMHLSSTPLLDAPQFARDLAQAFVGMAA